jgi:predicted Rossmann fold flavoprotein
MREERSDIAVIGAGPAGMMAAGRAAELGAKVLLIEKNSRPGKKLLMTGGGRCNITHYEPDARMMAEGYGACGKYLLSALSAFGVVETIEFFQRRGLPTKVEPDGRVFPASDSAQDVLVVLMNYMKAGGVKLRTGTAVTGIRAEKGRIASVETQAGDIIAGRYIVCTGGRSYPATGSSGELFGYLKRLGHKVTPLAPALVPVTVNEAYTKEAEGASLEGAGVGIWRDGKKLAATLGDVVFTARGLSGPAVLNISGKIRELMADGPLELSLDLFPDNNIERLDGTLRQVFEGSPNRLYKNALTGVVSPKIARVILALSGIPPDMRLNKISRKDRRRLAGILKGLVLTVKGLGGFERAMVTSGGVSTDEVQQGSMRSKLYENLYFAGEVLDLDGPTGGYNLQIAWSTGYIAGEGAARGLT